MRKKFKYNEYTYSKLIDNICEENKISIEFFLRLEQVDEIDNIFETINDTYDEIKNAKSENDEIKNEFKDNYFETEPDLNGIENASDNINVHLSTIDTKVEDLENVIIGYKESYETLLHTFIKTLDNHNIDLTKYTNQIDDDLWKMFVRKRKIQNIIDKN